MSPKTRRALEGSKPPPHAARSSKKISKVIDENAGRTAWTTWIWLLPIATVLPWLLSRLHYQLPEPLSPYDSNGLPQPSEELVLKHIQALEDIGYRTVGTPQARQGEIYVEEQVRDLQRKCDAGQVLQCDVWIQSGDGFHEFSLADHDVLKVYKGITNVILRIRARQPLSPRIKKDALLLGSHIDSTLPAPGAADDGIGVGVMLDIARVLVDRNEPFDNSIIFLWNGGEETLQDGSHLYSTQHETAKDVRAAINLEAAGSTGGALLFQATSKEMIEAFSKVPHPRGSVIAADVFASGIMVSDTDFKQFEDYLNVSGLDMAIVGHSYFYHTKKDRIEFIEKGTAQHFANNIIAVVDYLLSPSSPLHSENEWSPPNVVYLSMYDRLFLSWSMESATKVYLAIASVAITLAAARLKWSRWQVIALTLFGTPIGLVVGVVFTFIVAGIMTLLDSRLSWFKHEHLCLLIFVPASYLGHLSTQFTLSHFLKPSDRTLLEHSHYYAQLLFSALYMLLLQASGIRSAYLFAVVTSTMLIGAIGSELNGSRGKVHFAWSYAATLTVFAALGVEAVTTTLDIFVPLTGRMGKDAPAEFIIATISSTCGTIFFPSLIPLFHRLSRRSQRRTLLTLLLLTSGMVAFFVSPLWKSYDSMHPKRAGVQYTFNHTTGVHTANVAFMDSGPEYDFVDALHERYGTGSPVEKTIMNKQNSDWDVLYPVSSFLDTYRFELPRKDFDWPNMGIHVEELAAKEGHRDLKINLDFTGLVWPTLAFAAEITDWSFDFPPPEGDKRHHIKIATTIDQPKVELELTIRAEAGSKLSIHWIAIDLNQMVPGTASLYGPEMPASKLLLDLDQWAEERYDDSLELLLYGAVAGIVEV